MANNDHVVVATGKCGAHYVGVLVPSRQGPVVTRQVRCDDLVAGFPKEWNQPFPAPPPVPCAMHQCKGCHQQTFPRPDSWYKEGDVAARPSWPSWRSCQVSDGFQLIAGT